jgi:hypothetical protein
VAIEIYTYSVTNDTANGAMDIPSLESAIVNALDIPVQLHAISVEADAASIHMQAALSPTEEAALDALVAAHPGTQTALVEPFTDDGRPVVAPSVEYVNGMDFLRTGVKLKITRSAQGQGPVVNIKDYPITSERMIRGGGYQLEGSGHHEDDTIDLLIVDKDGVLQAVHGQPQGVVVELGRFVEDEPIVIDHHGEVRVPSSGGVWILAGLYLRVKYTAHGDDDGGQTKPAVASRFRFYE